jgi:hypothetical protein
MFEWYFLLAPFAVLAVLLLFRFVGCAQILELDEYQTADTPSGEPDYFSTLWQEAALVSYWRLHETHSEEPGTPTVDNTPVAGGTATDERGLNNGVYHSVIVTNSPPDSSDAPGTLILEEPGLLLSGGPNTSVFVDGGYVEVPFSNSLLLTSFTVEALVFPGWTTAETGIYRTVFAFTDFSSGFAVYSGPDPANPTSPAVWQLWLGDGTQFQAVNFNHGAPPLVDFTKTNYVAITYDNSSKLANLYTYVAGIELDDGPFRPVLDALVAIQPIANPAIGFVIGVDRTMHPFYPFQGRIQEVAIYNQALSMERICSHAVAAAGF